MASRNRNTGGKADPRKRRGVRRNIQPSKNRPLGGGVGDVDFEVELQTYNRHLTELLASEGKFVLIKGEDVDGPFATYAEALEEGYRKYELRPFLVKQIRPAEPILYFARDLG